MKDYQYHIFSPYRVCPLGAHVDNGRFIRSDSFDDFYRSRRMEVVYSKILFPSSCVVSPFHYTQIYDFTIGKSLRKWICKYGEAEDYESQQLRRYGEMLYPNAIVRFFC